MLIQSVLCIILRAAFLLLSSSSSYFGVLQDLYYLFFYIQAYPIIARLVFSNYSVETFGTNKKNRLWAWSMKKDKKTSKGSTDICFTKRLAISFLDHHNVSTIRCSFSGISQKLGERWPNIHLKKFHLTIVSNCVIGIVWNQELILSVKTHVR